MVKILKLTQGKQTLVDDEDYERFANRRFYYNGGYAKTSVSKHKKLYLHRMILDLKAGEECDHADGNPLNNTRCNLRVVTRSQNNMNAVKHSGTASRYKGLSWRSGLGKWQVSIQRDRRIYHLGHFVDEDEGARAYNEAALRLFGKYAKLNVITA